MNLNTNLVVKINQPDRSCTRTSSTTISLTPCFLGRTSPLKQIPLPQNPYIVAEEFQYSPEDRSKCSLWINGVTLGTNPNVCTKNGIMQTPRTRFPSPSRASFSGEWLGWFKSNQALEKEAQFRCLLKSCGNAITIPSFHPIRVCPFLEGYSVFLYGLVVPVWSEASHSENWALKGLMMAKYSVLVWLQNFLSRVAIKIEMEHFFIPSLSAPSLSFYLLVNFTLSLFTYWFSTWWDKDNKEGTIWTSEGDDWKAAK